MFGRDSCAIERIVARLDLQPGDFYFLHSLQAGSGIYAASSPVGFRGPLPRLKANVWKAERRVR
jgi:hypothetical protein